jgi:hypothetical protein
MNECFTMLYTPITWIGNTKIKNQPCTLLVGFSCYKWLRMHTVHCNITRKTKDNGWDGIAREPNLKDSTWYYIYECSFISLYVAIYSSEVLPIYYTNTGMKNGNEVVERNIFIFFNTVKKNSCLHQALFTV